MTSDSPDPVRTRWLLGIAGLLIVPLTIVWWPSCRQYPAVTSRESLELMQLLYTACNARDERRLVRVEQGLERLKDEGRLSEPEEQAYRKILGQARAGKWDQAERAAMRFARDQVGAEPASPRHK